MKQPLAMGKRVQPAHWPAFAFDDNEAYHKIQIRIVCRHISQIFAPTKQLEMKGKHGYNNDDDGCDDGVDDENKKKEWEEASNDLP